jgi:triosephosphate isomerase
VPTASQITEMHPHIRSCLIEHPCEQGKDARILYGGSVKPANARAILALPEGNGPLVGGASMKAADFLEILGAVPPDR